WTCDLVAVEVQDGQHRAVAPGIEELVRLPACSERARLCFAVANHAGDQQIGVVERRAVGVRERVAELAALVDRSRRLGGDVARYPAGKRELLEQPAQAFLVLRHGRIDLAVGALQISAGNERRSAMARTGHE